MCVYLNCQFYALGQLADHQATVNNKEMLLKEEILQKEKIINQNKEKYEIDISNAVKATEVRPMG